jgi:uncharacterized protein (TIGR03086 family)
MNEHLQSFTDNAARFTDVVARIDDNGWSRPSPCEGWTARDVLEHVIESQRDFLTRQGIALPEAAGDSPAQRWATHLDAVRSRVDDEVAATEYDGYYGRTSIGDTLANFYGFDMVVHRWDLARATGLSCEFTDDEMDRLEVALEGFGEHAYAEGVFERPVELPAEAPRQDRLLGLMGRNPAA